jgi:DNA repair protein RadC
MAMHEWAKEHRPREKLLNEGAAMLSDAELIAVLLRTGRRGESALEMARHLLDAHGGLGELAGAPATRLLAQPGLGPGKVSQWLASIELGKRVIKAELRKRDLLTESDAAAQYVISRLRHEQREVFLALYVNQANHLITDSVLSEGTVNQAVVYPRELVRKALEVNATGVIVAHNHPAGTLKPSLDDIELTHRLLQALNAVDIRLLDHFIVGGNATVSLRRSTRLFDTPMEPSRNSPDFPPPFMQTCAFGPPCSPGDEQVAPAP